jgi:ketosteroid isomerase-like protein
LKFARAQKLYTSTLIVCIGLVAHVAFAAGAKAAIEAANAEFSALAAKGNGAGLAALYTTDGQVMPAGSDPVRGTESIQKFWQSALDSGIAVVELKTLEVFGGGSTATEVGRYELRDKTGKTLDHGKYIVVWRHEGDKWKLLRDMFSTNVAPAKAH